MHNLRTLPEVVADILTYNGAIIESQKDGSIDLLVPPEVSKALSVAEYTRLCFSYENDDNEAVYASYDSDFFSSIGRLFDGNGRFSIVTIEDYIPNIEKLQKTLPEKIPFGNATFRFDKTEVQEISYLLVNLKYVALSDEKHEGVISLLINETNLSAMPFYLDTERLKEVLNESINIERHEIGKVLRSAYRASVRIAKEELRDFIKSLERRLNRDIKRVYEYYETLKEETKNIIKRKVFDADIKDGANLFRNKHLSSGDEYERNRLFEKQIEDRNLKGEGIEKLLQKLDAIEAEREWKVQDIITKYSLNIRLDMISAIRVETKAPLFWINIKRRLSSRRFPVTFNPISKRIDALPCESCFNPQMPYYICDDKLHIICADCFRKCPNCGKQYCNACYAVCRRCRK